ncbi:PTS cellobiose transporter subunit IIC [Clostridium sp. AF18-27]|uniref:Permease IIC component n=2 Tax=Enterocloster lavalensis TaxID=460384 RepID=A0A1I0B3P2_9FIRM|nr:MULTISPECIES: PTS cellobiose transporter subunit IIC [Enterocloster]MBS5604009.1 PTS cellobiose transporter subunit IIC [Enterocloster asparagiformis]RHR57155.1 PTS cellobiose transporter subunit IIC [Clostridium sp. AF18-27]MCB6341868.1 PTS cellobiose transporter subunit IIC [Enterocloster lavalensis]MDR3758452.1 PTS cellobiose transporter subunit IIC [Enterocloster sp.]PST31175.1 PTS system, cellobiose-specific IIC component [Enterocloster lavalensis]
MLSKLESVLMPLAEKIGKNKYLIAVRDGFLLSMPLLIVGSFFLLIANFPIPGWSDFWARFFGEDWVSYFAKPTDATFSIMAILAVVGIGYSFAEQMNVDKLFGAASAMVSWFLIMPYEVLLEGGGSVKGIPLDWVGSKGIFVGIICAFLSIHIYAWVNKKGWVIKMPEGVPPTVVKSFAALIPAGVSMLVFFVINIVFAMTPFHSAFDFIFTILQVPLLKLGNTLPAMVIAYIFLHLFWFFGVNGGSVVAAVFNPILQTLSAENLAAYQAGAPIPNIICQQFQDLFATFGGCGSALSLMIAMLLFCRSKRIRELGKLSLVPGLFGINEPIVFGLPIVLNPMILIPFMLVPTINIVISYICMSIGLVPLCSGVAIPWTMPVVLSGFLSTGWQGAVLQLVLLVLGIFVYMPFIKMMDKQYLADEAKATAAQDDDDISLDDLSFDDL